MPSSASSLFSFLKKNKGEIEKLVPVEDMKAALKDVDVGEVKEELGNALHNAGSKLDSLASQEAADGSISNKIMGLFTKKADGTVIETPQTSRQKKIVSFAIRNWRYSIPFAMSAFWWVVSWAWLLIFIAPVYFMVKKRMGSTTAKKTA